jgi:hypothetical protein
MKKIFLMLLLLCSNAFGAITDLKLSTAQIFDVQWYVSGGTLYASGFSYIYASVNYATQTASAARWTAAQTADAGSNGRYIGFFNSTTNPGTYGMAVFNSDGTKYKIINNTGSFRALANGAIFYNGNGMWGTLITTGQGYNNGDSGSWPVTQEYPSNAHLQAYTPPSSTPLAAGQTASSTGGGGGAVTPTWPETSDITLPQTTQRNAAKARDNNLTVGNIIYIEQKIGSSSNSVTVEQTGNYNKIAGLGGGTYAVVDGDNNTVNIKQGDTLGKNLIEFNIVGNTNNITVWQARNLTTGLQDGSESGGHYLGLNINGSTNTLNLKQSNDGGSSSGHFAYVDVTGANNNGTLKQSGNGEKTFFGIINGNTNVFDVSQQGLGSFLDLNLTGAGHSVTANQKDAGSHKATINLTNAGGASNVTLVQQGATAQNINITQQCATLSGCSVSVTQGQ